MMSTRWLRAGLVHVINKFRVKTLGLEPVRLGNKGPHLLAAHQVTRHNCRKLMASVWQSLLPQHANG